MKKIAITQRLVENDTYLEVRDALDVRWAEYCKELGAMPILLPSRYDYLPYFEELDIAGIILTGGNDLSLVSPSKFSQNRDAYEISLLDFVVQQEVPVLGVCRGMQLIAAYFGANLEEVNGHVSTRHQISIMPDCRYYDCYSGQSTVNSYHNNRVVSLPDSLRIVATADDGTVEALQHTSLPIEGQMWHPEREFKFHRNDILLAQQLFQL